MLSLVLALNATVFQARLPPQTSANRAARGTPTEVAALVDRARTARYQQDSALGRYEAIARQRWSARVGLSSSFGVGPAEWQFRTS